MRFIQCVFLVLLIALVLASSKKAKTTKAVNKDDDEEVKYSSKEDLDAKLKEIQRNREKDGYRDDTPSPSEMAQLREAEKDLRTDVIRAELNHGEFSKERAKALHALGGNMFRQQRFEELLELSKQIVRIHETMDGFEALMTGKALGNVGTVAHRLGLQKECELNMKRALYIMLHEGGLAEDSRDVLMHRGKMLSFQIKDGENTPGLSYDDYVDILEDEL